MEPRVGVLYKVLSRLFCCSKNTISTRKKPSLENFAIDSEFSEVNMLEHKLSKPSMMSSSSMPLKEAENSAVSPKDESKKIRKHPYRRLKKSSPKKHSFPAPSAQTHNDDKDVLEQHNSFGSCGNNELNIKSMSDFPVSRELTPKVKDIPKQGEKGSNNQPDLDSRNRMHECYDTADEPHRMKSAKAYRNTYVSSNTQLNAGFNDRTSDTSKGVYIGSFENSKAAENDPRDIIDIYREPREDEKVKSKQSFGVDRLDMNDHLSKKSGETLTKKLDNESIKYESIEAFLLSKPPAYDSSSEEAESETEVSCAIDFHDRKTFNKVLSKRMLAFLKFRQNNTKKHSHATKKDSFHCNDE